VIIEFRLSATEEIKRWLLTFGRNAEVLEPASLIAELREELAAMSDLYSLEPRSARPPRRARKRRSHT
jgi:predicted DNA-binding transcriptional regulator YafY